MQRLGSVPPRLRVKIISEKEVERMQILTTLNSSNELHENNRGQEKGGKRRI